MEKVSGYKNGVLNVIRHPPHLQLNTHPRNRIHCTNQSINSEMKIAVVVLSTCALLSSCSEAFRLPHFWHRHPKAPNPTPSPIVDNVNVLSSPTPDDSTTSYPSFSTEDQWTDASAAQPAQAETESYPDADGDLSAAADKAIDAVVGYIDKQLGRGIHSFSVHIAEKLFSHNNPEHVAQVIESHLDRFEHEILHDSVAKIEADVKDLIQSIKAEGRGIHRSDLVELAQKIFQDVEQTVSEDVLGFGKSILADLLKWLAERIGHSTMDMLSQKLFHKDDESNRDKEEYYTPSTEISPHRFDRRGLRDFIRSRAASVFLKNVLSALSLNGILVILTAAFASRME